MSDNKFKILETDSKYSNSLYVPSLNIIIDMETGVNYIEIRSSDGINIIPRLNADGTLYVSKGETNDSTN